jgi:hypothetical protein
VALRGRAALLDGIKLYVIDFWQIPYVWSGRAVLCVILLNLELATY